MDTVYVILPNGYRKEVNVSQTVDEVITECMANDTAQDHNNYALIFFGQKLQPNQQLSDIEHLSATRPLRLIRQKSNFKQLCSKEEVDRILAECRNRYRLLIEKSHPQISAEAYQMLLTYINEDNGQNYKNAFKEFPNLLHDQLGQNLLRDFRLLIQVVLKDDTFSHEHYHCLQVFKKALDVVYAKFAPSISSTQYQFSDASSSIPSTRTTASNQPVITQQMLTEAMAMAFGEGQGQQQMDNAASEATVQQRLEGQDNIAMHATFASQLQQMHEFGFINDPENIQALMLTNGNVEQALQIVIAMRE